MQRLYTCFKQNIQPWLQGLAGALVEAWRLYNVPSSVILFLIEDVTYNICDQKFHEFEVR